MLENSPGHGLGAGTGIPSENQDLSFAGFCQSIQQNGMAFSCIQTAYTKNQLIQIRCSFDRP